MRHVLYAVQMVIISVNCVLEGSLCRVGMEREREKERGTDKDRE